MSGEGKCHDCGRTGIMARAWRASEGERLFCHDEVRSCYNDRRGRYFDPDYMVPLYYPTQEDCDWHAAEAQRTMDAIVPGKWKVQPCDHPAHGVPINPELHE